MQKSKSSILLKQIDVTRVSNTIIRNHTTMVSNGIGYSVGAHIGGCIQLLLLTHPSPSRGLIWHVVFHDYPEYATGDVIGNAKMENPELARILDEIEKRVDDEHQILKQHDLNVIEVKILKIIDRLELLLWCQEQHDLGCRAPRFMGMFKRVTEVVEKLIQHLEMQSYYDLTGDDEKFIENARALLVQYAFVED